MLDSRYCLSVITILKVINANYIFSLVYGSGKTTLYYNELESSTDFGKRIDIDEIISSFRDWRDRKD